MSRIEELIKEKCPNGVEYRKLGSVCNLQNGFAFKSASFGTGTSKVLKITNIDSNGNVCVDAATTVDESEYAKTNFEPYRVRFGDVVVALSGATTGKVGRNLSEENLLLNQRVAKFVPSNELNISYLYHFILGKTPLLLALSGGGAQPNLSTKSIEDIEIPVPPIEIQMEIVRILDKFTELEAELQAELDVRKKQYEYYREKLILNAKNVEIKTLEEIATDIYRGAGIKRDETTLTGIPCVRYGEIYTSYNISFSKCVSFTQEDVVASPKYFEYGDILFAITGESIEDIAKSIAYLGNDKCICGGDIVVMKHKQEPRYISYALSTYDAIVQKGKGKVKSKVVHSSVPAIQKIRIPVPPMDEQVRIADKLDAFLTLIYDDNKGLLAEIDARHKQYEYYRDKLLTFERKVV